MGISSCTVFLSVICRAVFPHRSHNPFSFQMALSNMRSHSATCSKYESYVMEGIKSVKKEQPQQLVG